RDGQPAGRSLGGGRAGLARLPRIRECQAPSLWQGGGATGTQDGPPRRHRRHPRAGAAGRAGGTPGAARGARDRLTRQARCATVPGMESADAPATTDPATMEAEVVELEY